MQIIAQQSTAETSGALKSRRFEVRRSPVLLQLLSGLYSDPRRAVVREYGTNMLDAYVGQPGPHRPPRIVAPSRLEPSIRFEDFGRGMSFEEVWGVFGDYVASTKTGSNDEVGGLGLGAKTAFCYAGDQSWVVESRHDGVKHVFHAMRDKEGWPTLYHMDTSPTEEPNGVTVIVPVREGDFAYFKEQIEWFSTFFPMELELVGATRRQRHYDVRAETWALTMEISSGSVIMGNIAYPLDYQQLGISEHVGVRQRLDLYLPIGACDIAPNREALMYTDRTRTEIRSALSRFTQEYNATAQARLDACETCWEAVQLSQQIYRYSQYTGLKPQWRGADISNGLVVPLARLRQYSSEAAIERLRREFVGDRARRGRDLDEIVVEADEITHIFVDDLPVGKLYRLRQATKGRRVTVYAVRGVTVEQLTAELGGFPIAGLLSSLPGKPRKERAARQAPASVSRLHEAAWSPDEEVNPATGGVYVRLTSGEPTDYPATDRKKLQRFADALQAIGVLPDGIVYGIPRKSAKLERHPAWTELMAFAEPRVRALVREHREQMARTRAFHALSAHLQGLSHPHRSVLNTLSQVETLLRPESPAGRLAGQVGAWQRTTGFIAALETAREWCGVAEVPADKRVAPAFDRLLAARPMLRMIGGNGWLGEDMRQDAANYING